MGKQCLGLGIRAPAVLCTCEAYAVDSWRGSGLTWYMKELHNIKRFLPWWPAAVTAAYGLIGVAPVYERNFWLLLPCLAVIGIVAYTLQLYWEYTARKVGKQKEAWPVFLLAQLAMVQFGFIFNALQREDYKVTSTAVQLLGLYLVIICAQIAMNYRAKLSDKNQPQPEHNTDHPLP